MRWSFFFLCTSASLSVLLVAPRDVRADPEAGAPLDLSSASVAIALPAGCSTRSRFASPSRRATAARARAVPDLLADPRPPGLARGASRTCRARDAGLGRGVAVSVALGDPVKIRSTTRGWTRRSSGRPRGCTASVGRTAVGGADRRAGAESDAERPPGAALDAEAGVLPVLSHRPDVAGPAPRERAGGAGVSDPKGPRRSSSSASSSPSRSPGTTASTALGPSRGPPGSIARGAGDEGARRNASTRPGSISSPAAARWPPKRARCSAQAAQAGEQVEAGNAATRPAATPCLVERDQDHGPRSGARPDARRRSRRRRGASPRPRGRAPAPRELRGGQLAQRPLGAVRATSRSTVAALAVGAVELGGDLRRPGGVFGQHQLDARVGAVEPAGGVDPGREPEGEVALVEP